MSKPDIVAAIRSMALDKDNMPRMDSEKWLPIGVGLAAADEIERLRAALRDAKAWLEGEGLYDQADAIGIILGDVQ